ncbi:MAG: phosphate ABC transporter substrate-binding protein PstS family protein [Thermoplasmatota archaeon]
MQTKTFGLLTTLSLAIITLSGCTTSTGGGDVSVFGAATGGTIEHNVIRQEGSSTVLPAAELWAEAFQQGRGVDVRVAGGGSGKGASGLCNKSLDVGDMSRAMKETEKTTCRNNGVNPVEWIVAFDGLSVVVSKKNSFVTDLTVDQLHDLFIGEGHATTWDQIDGDFPAEKITLCYPDDDSGTYEYFNEAILHEAEPRKGGNNVQQSPDDNTLVNCIKDNEYAIGYFGYAYYIENDDKVNLVAVEGVKPSTATVAGGQYTPLSRPLYVYTNDVPHGMLKDYMAYILNADHGQQDVADVGYVPLDAGTLGRMHDQLGI